MGSSLKDLVSTLTLEEKIGQLIQIAPFFYIEKIDKNVFGPLLDLGISEEEIFLTGSVLGIKDSVKNASYRQPNVYFSSSDAKFNDRYEAKKNFHLVKEGKIEVKQGWRLYSSGPGIYINQVIRNILGIKVLDNKLYLDPMLKEAFDQTEVTYHYQGKKLHIRYLKGESVSLEINGKKMPMIKQQNQYRNAGFLIDDAFINQQETINITYYF